MSIKQDELVRDIEQKLGKKCYSNHPVEKSKFIDKNYRELQKYNKEHGIDTSEFDATESQLKYIRTIESTLGITFEGTTVGEARDFISRHKKEFDQSRPSKYYLKEIESVLPTEVIEPLFKYLEDLEGVAQKEEHHPEKDAFQHSLQVLYHAFRESSDIEVILAAMLHDIGKKENTLGHEEIACEWLEGKVSVKTLWLIKNHIRIRWLLDGKMKKRQKVLALVNHPWLPDLILLVRWDTMGRNPNKLVKYNKKDIMKKLEKVAKDHFPKLQKKGTK
jgi:hypothetical protein